MTALHRLICCPIHQSKIAGTVPPSNREYRDPAPACMFPAREATPSPTLQQRHRRSRTAAYPPGTHRPAAGSQRAELHSLQGPAGRDRPLFSVSGTAAASKHEVVTIAPRRRPSSSGDARRPGRQHRPACSALPCHVAPVAGHHLDDRRVDGGTESGTASVLLGVDRRWGGLDDAGGGMVGQMMGENSHIAGPRRN